MDGIELPTGKLLLLIECASFEPLMASRIIALGETILVAKLCPL